jgi:Undecaprenyl-phosphate galactose phosphotransferase WbaP
MLLAGDFLALAFSACLAVVLRQWANGAIQPEVYARLWVAPTLSVIAFAAMGLYPGVALNPAEELRRSAVTVTLVYVALAAATFLAKEAEVYSRGAFVLAWAMSVVAGPMMRGFLRRRFAAKGWWGYPVAILGSGPVARDVILRLSRHPELGLKPALVLSDGVGGEPPGTEVEGVSVVGGLDSAAVAGRELRIPYAIVAMPEAGREASLKIVERYGKVFSHLVVVSDLFGSSIMWISGLDLGGILGFEVQQRLLLPGPRRTKRLMDLVLLALGSVPVLILVAVLAVIVKLTSPGPVFFGQTRIGQGGRRFTAWKFRSMVADAERVLESYLATNPAEREQWDRDHKLKRDPRITAFGSFLRRSSLDELPQLWNVLKGEMSLVGPRPIVEAEIKHYSHRYHLYGRLKPGLTGLWQVSGRNDTTYAERVDYDSYYVRNWSVWLDLVILGRTVWTVVSGRGAY